MEQQELHRLEDTNVQLLGLEIKKIKLIRILEFFQGTLINFVRVCLLGTMFWLVWSQSISLGEFFSLYFYSFFIFSPLYQFGTVMQNYQEAKASDQLVKELLELGDDDIVHYGKARLQSIDTVNFSNVSFAYNESKEVLHDVTWSAKQGQTIAFV